MRALAQVNDPPVDGAIDNQSFVRLSKTIRDEAGIVLNESKRNLVVSRLSRRLRDLRIPSFSSYCDMLDGPQGKDERRQLISLLTTNVTRFFRENHHFDVLEKKILPALSNGLKSGGKVRIWSAGCSSGQEPYSIAMTILRCIPDAARHDIRVLATDIDPKMVQAVREGIYTLGEESDIPAQMRDRYFEPVDSKAGTYQAGKEIRGLVTSAELNLMHDWPMRGKFDVIFCRNTVIYFDGETQARLWKRFAEQLTPSGHLFVGHSERVSGPAESQFEPTGITQYQRR